MDAPFARHLARFSRNLPPPIPEIPEEVREMQPSEPTVTMTSADFERRVQAARDAVRDEMQRVHATRLSALEEAHAEAIAAAVAEVRAEADAKQGQEIGEQIATAVATLRDTISDDLAAALRPLLAAELAEKTRRALLAIVDTLLGEAGTLTILGPAEGLASVREMLAGRAGVTFEEGGCELVVHANGSRVATRLRAALAILDEAA